MGLRWTFDRINADSMFPMGTRGWILSRSNGHFSFHMRPASTSQVEVAPRFVPPLETSVGILIQGPVLKEGNFTVETVRLYRRIFPGSPIVVSTWDDTSPKILAQIESLGVKTVVSSRPAATGWGNVRLQMISTNVGIRALLNEGCSFVAKTRTDWRMYRSTSLSRLLDLINYFPLSQHRGQNKRIIAANIFTHKHRVYGLTDIFQFGEINDLLQYWDIESTTFKVGSTSFNLDSPLIVDGTPVVAEIFLCARYLSRLGIDLTFELRQWWDCLRDQFLVVDNSMLDAIWHKYEFRREHRGSFSYRLRGSLLVDHLDWLTLQLNANTGWGDMPFQERWVHGQIDGSPSAGGISQVEV